MRVLLTNDDGITAEGLYALYRKMRGKAEVHICAPEAEQSAIGHAITLSKPLRVKKVKKNGAFYGFAVDGTPADCVKIAVRSLLRKKPDLIISGINHGPNLGSDIMYSGTVSAATEGTILGIPSMAVSLATYRHRRFDFAARAALMIAQTLFRNKLPDGVLLNVNVPGCAPNRVRGVAVTAQGRSLYRENFVRRLDPRARTYYWLTGKVQWLTKPGGSDIKAVEENRISVTPLQLDLTAHAFMDKLRQYRFSRL